MATQNNLALSVIFHRIADCYRYLGADERFRAIAYENAARVLENMEEDIAGYTKDVKTLAALSGIGKSIAEKIIEYLQKGRIETFEQLKKKVPFELLELMDINGLGPSTMRTLYQKSGATDRQQLIDFIEAGKLKGLKGFGEKKIENIRRALKMLKPGERMFLKDAERIGYNILREIKKIPGVQKAELAGSLRRRKETIGDIDIIIVSDRQFRKSIVNRIVSLPKVEKVLVKGTTKVSVVLEEENVQVDVRLINSYEYGAALLYFTGSKEHTIKLRTIAKERGYKINEYGIFDSATGKRLAGETEEEMYHFLNLKYIPPEMRLDKGEIENADLGGTVVR